MSALESFPHMPGWYADACGRAVQRYWNGAAWTPYVIDASGQQRIENEPQPGSPAAPAASAQGHGIVIQNIVHQQQPAMVPVISVQPEKSTGVAVLLTILFGPLGLFYASVAGGAILTAATVLTLGLGIIVTWPAAIVWSIVAVNSHNERVLSVMRAPQPIHNMPYGGHGYPVSGISPAPAPGLPRPPYAR